jgi:hypothetical protein
MIDLLKFDLTAQDRMGGILDSVKQDIRSIGGVVKDVSARTKDLGRNMRNIGAGLSVGVTAPLTLLGKQAVELFDVQQQAESAVLTAITSTGGAAGRTLEQLKAQASELQGATTFGDEDILRNVTAPLLTFKEVQGEVFDRAQGSVLDLATLMKTDLQSATLQLGKALNDPIKGLGGLSRAGIQFTEDQKGLIKSLVEGGRVAEAQGIILQELEAQFGGQAAAVAALPLGQFKQLSNAIGDVKEQLGEQIVPFLMPLVETVKDAVTWFSELSPEVKRMGVIAGAAAAAAGPLLGFLGLAVIGLGALVSPVGLVVTGLTAVAGAAAYVVTNWDDLTARFPILEEAATRVGGAFSVLWDGAKASFEAAGTVISGVVSGIVGIFSGDLTGAIDGFGSAFRGIGDLISASIGTWIGFFEQLFPGFQAVISDIIESLRALPGQMLELGGNIIEGLKDGIVQKWQSVKGNVTGVFTSVIDGAKGLFETQSPSRVFREIGGWLIEGLGLGMQEKAGLPGNVLSSISDNLKSGLDGFQAGIKESSGQFGKLVTDVATGARSINDVLSQIGSNLVSSGISGLTSALGLDDFFAGLFDSGGFIPGGQFGLVAERRPEEVNGSLLAVPSLVRGPARVVGGAETARRMGAGGSSVALTYAPVIDARGADQAAVTRIEMQLRQQSAEFEGRVRQVLVNGRRTRSNGIWEGV